MSAFGGLARRPKYIRAIRNLLDKLYLGALQGAQKALKKFASSKGNEHASADARVAPEVVAMTGLPAAQASRIR